MRDTMTTSKPVKLLGYTQMTPKQFTGSFTTPIYRYRTEASVSITPRRISKNTSRLRKRSWVEQETGLSRSAIYDRMDAKSTRYDPTFPKPVKTGLRSVAWYEDEIHQWKEQLQRSKNEVRGVQ